MNKSQIQSFLTLAVALCLLGAGAFAAAAPPERPNIIWIIGEDMRPADAPPPKIDNPRKP